MGLLDWFKKRELSSPERMPIWSKSTVTQPEPIWDVKIPDGLSLYPFQEHGVKWLCGRKRVLLSDAPGLGKSVQIAAVINTLKVKPILIVCPATLKLNWQIELEKWLVNKHTIQVVSGKTKLEGADITIINYDLLSRFDLSQHWSMVVCDEAHYLKNPSTKRYKSLFNRLDTDRLYLLTGTPIVNRPIELWSLLKQLDNSWSNYKWYTERYCGATLKRVSYDRVIRDVSGASNLDELHRKIQPLSLRRLRSEVLKDLPDKTRQIITLPANGASAVILSEQDITKRKLSHIDKLEDRVKKATTEAEFYAAVSSLETYITSQFSDLASARQDIGIAKVKPAIEHIKSIIESGDKVVVFAHHRSVINMLASELPGALVITGSTPNRYRQEIVEEFQSDPNAKVFIGNIRAAGVGITLTAAHHVVFVELDYTPGNMEQAEDRVVRIGQKNSVLIQWLVFDGSLDARIAKILSWKQSIINRAIEGKK